MPGSSTKIRLLPRFKIDGSFVPIHLFFFLLFQWIDLTAADLKFIIPCFDKKILTLFI